MNELLSGIKATFVSALSAVNVQVSDGGGITPQFSVPDRFSSWEEILPTSILQDDPGVSDIVTYRDLIGAESLADIGTEYTQMRQRNGASMDNSGGYSYEGGSASGMGWGGGPLMEDTGAVCRSQKADVSCVKKSAPAENLTAVYEIEGLFNGFPEKSRYRKGRITVNGRSYPFISGGRPGKGVTEGRGYVPTGPYEIKKEGKRSLKGSWKIGGFGYTYALTGQGAAHKTVRDERYPKHPIRNGLLIHPDGGPEGTWGCWGIQGSRGVQEQFKADLDAEIQKHSGKVTVNLTSSGGSCGEAAPPTGACPLVKKHGVTAHQDFMQKYEALKKYADQQGIQIIITSSFRSQKKNKNTKGIVKPASRSNHLIGHAIDFNIKKGGSHCNSSCLRANRHQWVRDFIRYGQGLGLRWGQSFNDPVHFDIPVNINNKAKWDQLYETIATECNEDGSPKNPQATPSSGGSTPASDDPFAYKSPQSSPTPLAPASDDKKDDPLAYKGSTSSPTPLAPHSDDQKKEESDCLDGGGAISGNIEVAMGLKIIEFEAGPKRPLSNKNKGNYWNAPFQCYANPATSRGNKTCNKRRDADGCLNIYWVPAGDAGIVEVAGVTKRYLRGEYEQLASLVRQRRQAKIQGNEQQAQQLCQQIDTKAGAAMVQYAKKWNKVTGFHRLPPNIKNNPGAQFVVYDSTFNNGQGGAKRIILDMQVANNPQQFIENFRRSRINYVRRKGKFVKALTDRANKAAAAAQQFASVSGTDTGGDQQTNTPSPTTK